MSVKVPSNTHEKAKQIVYAGGDLFEEGFHKHTQCIK